MKRRIVDAAHWLLAIGCAAIIVPWVLRQERQIDRATGHHRCLWCGYTGGRHSYDCPEDDD